MPEAPFSDAGPPAEPRRPRNRFLLDREEDDTARVRLTLSPDEADVIEDAARLSGKPVTTWMIRTLVDIAAQRVDDHVKRRRS